MPSVCNENSCTQEMSSANWWYHMKNALSKSYIHVMQSLMPCCYLLNTVLSKFYILEMPVSFMGPIFEKFQYSFMKCL